MNRTAPQWQFALWKLLSFVGGGWGLDILMLESGDGFNLKIGFNLNVRMWGVVWKSPGVDVVSFRGQCSKC